MRPRPIEDVLSYLDKEIKRLEEKPPTNDRNWHYRFGQLSALKIMASYLNYRWPKHYARLDALIARAEAAQNAPYVEIVEGARNLKVAP